MSQQLKNKLTGLTPTPPGQETPTAETPTRDTHIVIPLTQNILGGLAVTVLCNVVLIGLGRHLLWRLVYQELLFWSSLAGLGVASAATIVRFFGDEIGIIKLAYNLGKRSADSQVSGQADRIRQLEALLAQFKGQPVGQVAAEMEQRIARAFVDAQHLLSLAHSGISISREQVSGYISQRPWERAMQLLRAAGCLTEQGSLVEPNLKLSLDRLSKQVSADTQRSQAGDYTPAWYANTRRQSNKPPQHRKPDARA